MLEMKVKPTKGVEVENSALTQISISAPPEQKEEGIKCTPEV
jgi:hypothetical protein